MPRLHALKPFTQEVGGDDSAYKDSAIEEGEEDFITRPATEQIKRRLSGVEHPGESIKAPAWQSLQVCSMRRACRHHTNEWDASSPCISVSPEISPLTRRTSRSACPFTIRPTPPIIRSGTSILRTKRSIQRSYQTSSLLASQPSPMVSEPPSRLRSPFSRA